MGLKNLNTGTSSVGELAKQLDNANAENAGKYLQSLTGTVSGLIVTVINGKGEYEADPSLPAFDPNFTRESYGKAAVSDSVVTKTDRKSYLLDNRQQPTERAEAVISALEYHNGLDILKNEITDTEFSNQLSEPNLDVFNEYPEEIFVNASELDSTTKQQFIFDAIVASVDAMDGLGNSELALQSVTTFNLAEDEINSSNMATGKYIAARSGLDHTAVSDASTLTDNQSKMQTVAQSSDGMNDGVNLSLFMDKVANSTTAMGEVSTTQNAMDSVIASDTALTSITTVSSADQTYHNSSLYGDALASVGVADVAGVGGISLIVASSTAMGSVSASTTGMNKISESPTALNTISTSSTGMSNLSSNSVSYITSNWTENSLADGESPPVASVYYAEVEAEGSTGGGEQSSGSDGGDASFGGALAEGATKGGNDSSGDVATEGGTQDNTTGESIVIDQITGGGGSGGGSGPYGGYPGEEGGRITALIANPDKNILSATLGSRAMSNGSVKVWVPPTAY